MTKIRLIILTIICITLTNCKSEKHEFPIDKRYWDVNDYDKAILELSYNYESDEKLPTFDDPETRIIVQKLTDQQNFKVILDDNELGLKYKNEVSGKLFIEYRDMLSIYTALDRKDQYLYDKEMLANWHFFLAFQLRYFKLGSDLIKENADDPNSSRAKNKISSNVRTLIKNYLIYLDHLNNEKAFTESGKRKLAEGIDIYFTELIEMYPNANYSVMRNKAELILKKSKAEEIKLSLTKLITLINLKETGNK